MAISVAAPCVALVFVILRLCSRKFLIKNPSWDDCFLVLPMILPIGFIYATVKSEPGICNCYQIYSLRSDFWKSFKWNTLVTMKKTYR